MRVLINLVSYEQPAFDVTPDTLVNDLKQMIQDDEGIDAQCFDLFFNKQKLESAMSLGHYNIHDGDVLDIDGWSLNAVLRPRCIAGTKKAGIDNMLSTLAALALNTSRASRAGR